MEPFEYLTVLISIIVGLGLSHLLATAARLIQERGRVEFFGPTLIWMAVLFTLQVQIWWAAFEWQATGVWAFFPFLLFLGLPVGAYLLSVLLVPDLDVSGPIDLRAAYFEHRTWFFSGLAVLPILSLAHEYVQAGRIQLGIDVAFRLGFAAAALVGVLVSGRRVHWVLTVAFALIFLAYIGLLFRHLPLLPPVP